MKLTKCVNKHFYDADKFAFCPHCQVTADSGDAAQITSTKGGSNKAKKNLVGQSQHDQLRTTALQERVQPEENFLTEAVIAGVHNSCVREEPDLLPVQETVMLNEAPNVRELPEVHTHSSLRAAVDSVRESSANSDSKTMAFYNIAETDPVVGWLVCVTGAYAGECFNLKTGRNMVGRSLKMDIALAKELSISRDRHAVITYEPKKRKFYIQSGDSSGLIYVNDDLLMVPTEIVDFDRIEIGNCGFILRTLCGEKFTWDDYI